VTVEVATAGAAATAAAGAIASAAAECKFEREARQESLALGRARTRFKLSREHEVSELGSGVRVVTEAVPWVRSVALGLWVRTGSRDEAPEQAGVSHFLEHRHSAIQISEIFDGLGASVNAATSKETTHLNARFLDEHTERAFDVLAEMLLGPTYPEVDSEREVVLEEIAMYEDEPADRVHDFLADAIFGEHPLGRRVLGAAEVIASIPVPAIDGYHSERYTAPNIVVAAAGHLDHERIVALAEEHLSPADRLAPANADGAPGPAPRLRFHPKDTEQYHVCFGGPGIDRADERRFALSVLDSILGGSSSSRLFSEVREKRGLAYAVGSYTEQYSDSGVVATYVGTREDNVQEACEVIGGELRRIAAEPVTAEELVRAKEHVKGRLVLSSESMAARMSRIARSALFDLPLLTLDEMLQRIDDVAVEDVGALAAELYRPDQLSTACIGPEEYRFRAAVAPVSEALAAA
jgi:predicted Zn-dependent peptidase